MNFIIIGISLCAIGRRKRTVFCARCVQLWICSAAAKSLVILEVENNDFNGWRCLKRQVVPLSGSVLLAQAPLSK